MTAWNCAFGSPSGHCVVSGVQGRPTSRVALASTNSLFLIDSIRNPDQIDANLGYLDPDLAGGALQLPDAVPTVAVIITVHKEKTEWTASIPYPVTFMTKNLPPGTPNNTPSDPKGREAVSYIQYILVSIHV